jgi:hypothetical protein|tara:strand:+ start:803 stop:976 length:174 start_codon:yes stop_codon:yes gene_type:complete
MVGKISALFHSRRFWLALGGVVFTLADGLGLGISPDQVNHLVVIGGAWIVGDSLRTT